MNPDDLQQAWQSQPDQKMDVDMLVAKLKQSQQQFSATLFIRDATEVVVAGLMVPIWIAMGIGLKLPWTWYLTIPALLWIGGFMLAGLLRRRREEREQVESLRERVKRSLAEVEHQIRLLRSVFWWYLFPMLVSMLAFFAQVSWNTGLKLGWPQGAMLFAITTGFVAIVFTGIYVVNQRAVRANLEPRRRELEETLQSLSDDPVPANDR